MLSVSVLCTDIHHPVNAWLERWVKEMSDVAMITIKRDFKDLVGGDFLFLVSCHQIILKPTRDLFRHTLVLHASALPNGRGMSPHIWQILEGRDRITVTLLNAEDALDSGDIWHQVETRFHGGELHDEINAVLFDAELELMNWALANCDRTKPWAQSGSSTFYRRRVPDDSRIDPARPLLESFNLLRVADPQRYPAYFEHLGKKYFIRIERG